MSEIKVRAALRARPAAVILTPAAEARVTKLMAEAPAAAIGSRVGGPGGADVVAGGETKDLFAVYGWSSAQLFVQALKAAGPKAKRSDVMAALRKITKFDADGLLAAADPANKKPATCWMLNVVKDGKFVRVDSPASTFRCDGSYFPAA